jgi:hypothetical protein
LQLSFSWSPFCHSLPPKIDHTHWSSFFKLSFYHITYPFKPLMSPIICSKNIALLIYNLGSFMVWPNLSSYEFCALPSSSLFCPCSSMPLLAVEAWIFSILLVCVHCVVIIFLPVWVLFTRWVVLPECGDDTLWVHHI